MNKNKEKLKKINETVSKILYYYDPVGLAKLKVPEDEYEIEARVFIDRLKDVTDLRSLRLIVYEVFVYYFDEDMILPSNDNYYRLIAEEIWEVCQEVIQA